MWLEERGRPMVWLKNRGYPQEVGFRGPVNENRSRRKAASLESSLT